MCMALGISLHTLPRWTNKKSMQEVRPSMPCFFVWSSVCGKSGFSSLKLSENEAGRDCHLCFLWRFRWPWWTVLCRTRGANLRSKSSKSTWSRRKTSPSPPIWRRTSLRASEIEPRMWATRLNPQWQHVVRTTRFLQTNESKTIIKPRERAGSKNAIHCRICMNLLQEDTSSHCIVCANNLLYEKLYIYISHVSPLFFLSSFASSPCSFISKNLLLRVTTALYHRETFQMQPLRCRLLWRQHSWVVSSRPSTTTCSMPRRQTTAQAVLSEAQFIRQQFVSNPKTRDSLPLNRGLHNDSFWTGWANATSTLYGELSFDCVMGKVFPFF